MSLFHVASHFCVLIASNVFLFVRCCNDNASLVDQQQLATIPSVYLSWIQQLNSSRLNCQAIGQVYFSHPESFTLTHTHTFNTESLVFILSNCHPMMTSGEGHFEWLLSMHLKWPWIILKHCGWFFPMTPIYPMTWLTFLGHLDSLSLDSLVHIKCDLRTFDSSCIVQEHLDEEDNWGEGRGGAEGEGGTRDLKKAESVM